VDAKLEAVVANWSARFVANEIDQLDVDRTLAEIETWHDWPDAWERAATRYADLGAAAASGGHRLTAAQHRRRAALVLQFAQFVLTEDVPRRERLHRRQCALYRQAAPDLVPPAVPYERRVGDAAVHGYLRLPRDVDGPSPVVLLVPGLESTKEQFTTYEPYFLDRGVATVTMEGPGQGEGWYAHPFDLTTYLACFRDVLGWLGANPELDRERVAVLGTSFGGFLALRCAAEVSSIGAVVDIAGPHTLLPLEDLQPVLQEGFIHLTHSQDLAQATQRLADVTLDGALGRLAAPTLVVHGDADGIIDVAHGDRIAAELGEVTYDRVAGGTHSCNNIHTVIRPRVADWVADQLNGVTVPPERSTRRRAAGADGGSPL
jgi:pimeloyl-ACP methyl ester carboxylesterase